MVCVVLQIVNRKVGVWEGGRVGVWACGRVGFPPERSEGPAVPAPYLPDAHAVSEARSSPAGTVTRHPGARLGTIIPVIRFVFT